MTIAVPKSEFSVLIWHQFVPNKFLLPGFTFSTLETCWCAFILGAFSLDYLPLWVLCLGCWGVRILDSQKDWTHYLGTVFVLLYKCMLFLIWGCFTYIVKLDPCLTVIMKAFCLFCLGGGKRKGKGKKLTEVIFRDLYHQRWVPEYYWEKYLPAGLLFITIELELKVRCFRLSIHLSAHWQIAAVLSPSYVMCWGKKVLLDQPPPPLTLPLLHVCL